MFIISPAIADTYITNKIISNKFRATDANVGRAGSLDLFKLYSENEISGEVDPIELSRILIKFDLSSVRALTASTLDIADSSFNVKLQLFDILGGNTVPSNFNIVAFPLSRSFDEGNGRDVAQFSDLDRANFITASFSVSNNVWFASGANQQGLLNSSDIDIISSGNVNDGQGIINLFSSQYFESGAEKLNLDVTKIVSATLAGLIPDNGFRISFSGSQETDSQTRFVKRFASRHSSNRALHPRLLVSFDDSSSDNSRNFYFDSTGSVFLNNTLRNQLTNIVSGTGLTPVVGANCLLMKLQTGSYVNFITASQFTRGETAVTGVYKATFSIPSAETSIFSGTVTLADLIAKSGSIDFDQYWISLDNSVAFLTSSINIKSLERTAFSATPKNLRFTMINAKKSFKQNETFRARIFVENLDENRFSVKVPIRLYSIVTETTYYKIIDLQTRQDVVPFLVDNNGTKLSSDSNGLYFDIKMSGLPIGRRYGIVIRTYDGGLEREYFLEEVSFTVEP
jgi:hypothetical protein